MVIEIILTDRDIIMTEMVLTETIPTDQDTTMTEITLTEITLTDQDTIIPVTEIILTDRDLTMTEMVRTEEDSLTMAVVVRIVADFPGTEIVRAASTSRSSVTGRITETTGSTITETILRWDSARMTRMIIIIREEVQEQIPVRILKQKRCRARI